MAIILCPECGKEVSDKAASCPNCGYPIAKRNEELEKNNKLQNLSEILKKEFKSNNIDRCISLCDQILIEDINNYHANIVSFLIRYSDVVSKAKDIKLGLNDEMAKETRRILELAVDYLKNSKESDRFEEDLCLFYDGLFENLIYTYVNYNKTMKRYFSAYISGNKAIVLDMANHVLNIMEFCVSPFVEVCESIVNIFDADSEDILKSIPEYAKDEYWKFGASVVCMIMDTYLVSNSSPKERILTIIENLRTLFPNYIVPEPNVSGYPLPSSANSANLDNLHKEKIMKVITEGADELIKKNNYVYDLRSEQISDYKKHYLDNHPELKEQYHEAVTRTEENIEDLNKQIDQLDTDIKEIQAKKSSFSSEIDEEAKSVQAQINELQKYLNGLGLFKMSEKKKTQEQIEVLIKRNNELLAQVRKEKEEFEKPFDIALSDFNDKKNNLFRLKSEANNRISELKDAYTNPEIPESRPFKYLK